MLDVIGVLVGAWVCVGVVVTLHGLTVDISKFCLNVLSCKYSNTSRSLLSLLVFLKPLQLRNDTLLIDDLLFQVSDYLVLPLQLIHLFGYKLIFLFNLRIQFGLILH